MAKCVLVVFLLHIVHCEISNHTQAPFLPCSFHSQYKEDEVLEGHFFRGLRNGTFVEIGAMDGITLSNSLYFEKCRHWAGLLIEGNRNNFRQLQRNLLQRPRSKAIHSAVCPPPMTKVNFTISGTLVAGSQLDMAPSFVRKYHVDKKRRPRYVEVPCSPMSTLFRGLSHIDLWSLDVEGAELVAIETVDWSSIRIDVIIIELDYHFPPKNLRIRQILRSLGYKECRWGSLRGSNAIFLSNASRYTCGSLGDQTCLCSYDDCDCDGIKRRWMRKGKQGYVYQPV
eukprot:GGOE01065272.1.p1 GENE.GGOE01065272.1~~GGOE01065272.1.p1  ORF type:complete len:294 (+),score=55.87 GGOE01065272.1:34-882(+)